MRKPDDAPSCPVVFKDAVSSPRPVTLTDIASRREPTCILNRNKKMIGVFDAVGVATVPKNEVSSCSKFEKRLCVPSVLATPASSKMTDDSNTNPS